MLDNNILIGGIGALVLVLFTLTWRKLDRISLLFMHAEDEVKSLLREHQKTLTCHGERITFLEAKLGEKLKKDEHD